MEHLLPHEITKWGLEMQEAAEIEERREEELRVAEVEVEKILSVKESAVEYQQELWRSHYYEYYNLEGDAEDEDEDEDAVDFSRETQSPPTTSCRQDKSSTSHLTPAMHRPARWRIFNYAYLGFVFNAGLLLEQCLGQLTLCNY